MVVKLSKEQETEKIARRLAKEAGQPESLWELFLTDAYREYFNLSGRKRYKKNDRE